MYSEKSQAYVDVSLVSHGHGSLILSALEALKASVPDVGPEMSVWLTLNIPEPALETAIQGRQWPFQLQFIRNTAPLGFGANHNQAFKSARAAGQQPWFVVLNPDIFLPMGARDFWRLLEQDPWPAVVGLLCPVQVDTQGSLQDYARQLITPLSLLLRVFRRLMGFSASGVARSVEAADWVNGACMVWRSECFEQLGGFDERFFMYCEDTDICLRMQLAGWRISGADLQVVHDAHRQTNRSFQHLQWHLRSMLRLWLSPAFWQYVFRYRKS